MSPARATATRHWSSWREAKRRWFVGVALGVGSGAAQRRMYSRATGAAAPECANGPRGCAACEQGERVRVWAEGVVYEGEVTGVEPAMDVYDIGVTILYDGETATVNERLGSFEWELLM